MEENVLKASKRAITGKQVKKLRNDGMIPGVVYGRGVSTIPITLNNREVQKLLSSISSSQLINLAIDGKDRTTLVRDKQLHPVTGRILHIDFLEVSMSEKLKTDITISIQGEAPAATNFDGILVTGLEAIQVECLPQDLPERVVVDISVLEEIGDSIFVRDINLPPEVEILSDLDEMVIVVTTPAAEEEEIEEEEELLEEEPEVIEKGKREEEEGETDIPGEEEE
jgi:large subunit ribosomal protein L25